MKSIGIVPRLISQSFDKHMSMSWDNEAIGSRKILLSSHFVNSIVQWENGTSILKKKKKKRKRDKYRRHILIFHLDAINRKHECHI